MQNLSEECKTFWSLNKRIFIMMKSLDEMKVWVTVSEFDFYNACIAIYLFQELVVLFSPQLESWLSKPIPC